MDYQSAHNFMLALAKEAGAIARQHFSQSVAFVVKSDNSPVTIADEAINRLVIERCRQEYPEIDILGEEESDQRHDSRYLWVVDPIDGTIPYTLGIPYSSFCLALVDDGEPVVGVVYDFNNDRLYSAIKDSGVWLNGKPLSVDDAVQPMKLVCLEWWHSAAYQISESRASLSSMGYQVPNYASAALSSINVALRRITGVIYSGDKPWDGAASKVIVEELGGVSTDLAGGAQRYDQPIRGYIVCVPEALDDIVRALPKL